MNAACQPQCSAIHGTMIGVTIAPTFEPALKIPVANARSRAREPLGDRLDRRRKISRLAEAEREARRAESSRGARERVRHRRDAPDDDRAGEAAPRADAVHDAAGDEEAERVRDREPRDDVAVLLLVPAEVALQRRREDAEHLAVDVVDRRREEQQRADRPPISSDRAVARTSSACGRVIAARGRWRRPP